MSILSSGGSPEIMIWVMSVIAILGVSLLSICDSLKKDSISEPFSNENEGRKLTAKLNTTSVMMSSMECLQSQMELNKKVKDSWQIRIKEIRKIAFENRTLFLLTYMFTQGSNMSFSFTVTPSYVPLSWDHTSKSLLLAEIFFCYGSASMLLSLVIGKVYDRFGWKPLVLLNLTIMLLAMLFLIGGQEIFYDQIDDNTLTNILFAVGLMFGASDTASNSLLNIALSNFGESAAPAFGVYRILYCVGTISGSLIFIMVGRTGTALVNLDPEETSKSMTLVSNNQISKHSEKMDKNGAIIVSQIINDAT
ncbi:hypothetical protein HK096_006348, partial [Nowakowskiella sp. JEL0078]